MRIISFFFIVSVVFLNSGCKKSDSTPPAPAISGFSPMSDTIGAKIVITGSNFNATPANNIVKFNGITAEVVSATPTQLTCLVPAGVANGPLSVTVNGQTVTSADAFTLLGPAITGFTPSLIGIGYPLTITGTNFSTDPGSNAVTINGVAATVTSATSTLLTTVVPLSATTGKIVVTVKGQPSTSANNILIRNLIVTTLAGTGIGGATDGPANTASFSSAWGIVTDGNGNYYIGDNGNNKVRKLSSTGVVSTVAGTGVAGNIDGPAATATFANVYGIALDSHGNIFVTCIGRNNIREISTNGIVSTFAGDINGSSGSADGLGTAARFNTPLGITIDKNDNVFIMDASNFKVRKISPAGLVSTLAGSGLAGSADGVGSAASFFNAWGLGIDHNDNLYVCDVGNNKIRKVTQAGVVTTFAGSGVKGSADGPVLSASFNGAIGIVTDQAGNFYVTDEGNNRIRMISADGQVYTLAGNGNNLSVDGSGNFASFSFPLGITIDATGVMAVVDNGTQKIRKIVVQ